MKSVAGDNVGYIVDSWDWLVSGSTIEQLNEIPGKKIVTARLGSIIEGVAVADATTVDRVLPEVLGPLNHVAFVKKLKSQGYDGPIGPSASSSQYKGETREYIVSTGQELIDDILTQAGINVPPRPKDTLSQYPEEPMIMTMKSCQSGACKPGSVPLCSGNGHLSGATIACRLKRSTRMSMTMRAASCAAGCPIALHPV